MKKILKFKLLCPIISVIFIVLSLLGVGSNFLLINTSPINSYLVYIKNFKLDNLEMMKFVIYGVHFITFILYGFLIDFILKRTKIFNKKIV